MQAFRGSAQSSTALDLQVALDEPTQLIRELVDIAGERTNNQEWTVIFYGALDIQKRLEALQSPAGLASQDSVRTTPST